MCNLNWFTQSTVYIYLIESACLYDASSAHLSFCRESCIGRQHWKCFQRVHISTYSICFLSHNFPLFNDTLHFWVNDLIIIHCGFLNQYLELLATSERRWFVHLPMSSLRFLYVTIVKYCKEFWSGILLHVYSNMILLYIDWRFNTTIIFFERASETTCKFKFIFWYRM